MSIGLAGPPAPILHWAGHFRIGPYGTQVLPFRSLAELPAELLAIPVPTTSWAFEEMPVMSLNEWEEYRRRSTSTVLLTTNESSLSRAYRLLLKEPGEFVPILVSFWQLVCLLLRHLFQWQLPSLTPTHSPSRRPTVLPLCNRATGSAPAQTVELSSDCHQPSVQSSSTELRASPSAARDIWLKVMRFLQEASRRIPVSTVATPTKIYRPTVPIRGCLPKGFHIPYLL